ncbi:hypothetical protein CVT26_008112 [Gymnopilus dilepis]|uniref:Uncharacterized protein n=1 Tax=Gymnopilus dilepis TaxID=231916 RepID=A0A409YJP2_9AGAR|nr:hypothetical protein CVT26_008112 [Gymnopilus dilepis]
MTSAQISNAVQIFIQDLHNLPSNSPMDNVLKKAVIVEEKIRRLFATDPHNRVLEDPFLGLIDIFDLSPAIRRTRARLATSKEELENKYIFPVRAPYRRINLSPSTVPDLKAFQAHWEVFTHGALSKMSAGDWENVVVAGGSVLACLAPPLRTLPPKELHELYQSKDYATSDIDLFLWGLTPEEAKLKMENIYTAICSASEFWDVVCVRKANVVSIHNTLIALSKLSFASISLLRKFLRGLMSTPLAVLTMASLLALWKSYLPLIIPPETGQKVWVNPRCLTAIIRQANTVDITRRSPSYEIRLAKYAVRGFEIYIPSLKRTELNPALYAKTLPVWPNGLARLLVLERAYYSPWFYDRLKYPTVTILKKKHLAISSRQNAPPVRSPGSASSNYDHSLNIAKIPYGPHWNAKDIENLVSTRDASMNSRAMPHLLVFEAPYNDLNTGHRHIFFAGTMQECFQSFCSTCERRPLSINARANGDMYIRGPITFMTVNPGRQLLTGSFRPMEVGDWASEAYGQ